VIPIAELIRRARAKATTLPELVNLLVAVEREANARDNLHAERKGYLDAIAQALHPRWPAKSRKTYAPQKLAGMIKSLIHDRRVARSRASELEPEL